jgi:uncharacterized repeat protein (TIGR01451 family)
MNIFTNRLSKVLLGLTASAVLAVSLTASTSATGSFGPSRTTMPYSSGAGFNYVTFDSFTNMPNGVSNEEDFYQGVDAGRDSAWSNPVQNVNNGDEVEAKIYIDNDALQSLDSAAGQPGVAQNVTVSAKIPSGFANNQTSTAYISASNATPATVYDGMQITGANGENFELSYVPGSGQLHGSNGTVTTLTSTQESALTGSGLNIGNQPGCPSYLQEITFEMKVAMPSYTISKVVGVAGQSSASASKSINTTPGSTLGWLVTFTNTGATELDQVIILDQVPTGLTVVPGSVKLIDGSYPSGYVYPSSAVQDNGRQINVNIGDYAAGIAAYVTYQTTVNTDGSVPCGTTNLVNEAYATPQGLGSIYDTADANVSKSCPTTPPTTPTTTVTTAKVLVNTGPGDVIGIFAIVTVVGAIAHRLFMNRRLSKQS